MLDVSAFRKISEYEEVEKVVYLVRTLANGHTVSCRVEAVRDSKGKYSTRAYEQMSVILQPSDIEDGKQIPTQHQTIWVSANAPWTHRDTADAAIAQLLSLWES
jgi:hypothetical protein